MMYFRDRAEQDNAARRTIENYRTAAALCAQIKPIIAAFDGKVYNCRLGKKLAEIGRIYCKNNGYCLSIYVYADDCYNSQLTLCSLPLEKALINKRLQADQLHDACNAQREYYLKRAYDLEKQLEYIDIYAKRFKEIDSEVKKLHNALPRELVYIYNLDYHLKRG